MDLAMSSPSIHLGLTGTMLIYSAIKIQQISISSAAQFGGFDNVTTLRQMTCKGSNFGGSEQLTSGTIYSGGDNVKAAQFKLSIFCLSGDNLAGVEFVDDTSSRDLSQGLIWWGSELTSVVLF